MKIRMFCQKGFQSSVQGKVPTDLPIYLESTSLNVGGGTSTVASFVKYYPNIIQTLRNVFISRLVVSELFMHKIHSF
jgi:hypothetical protein